ncbi:MAG: DEAD/DEAH box helicase [Candidatus Heimdallarchaeota archaeon]|nr:DEAD/DEAH box helicase [Candidatus Heimdallarchaeota archaeon]MCK5047925.1 DEAD/DEAH box helicase [Candidatus Heimdallarchaeota archaeon]
MKNLKTLTVIVKDGKTLLDLPEFTDGTKLELRIISIEKSLQEQQTDQYLRDAEKVQSQDIFTEASALADEINLFHELNLIDPLLQAIEEQGYSQPSPIQAKAIPIVLKKRDILATAQTGSGKTAAFALPIIQILNAVKIKGKAYPRALILTPTRELAGQIGENITNYARHTYIRHATIYGGVSQHPQVRQLKQGKDIIVATPGRLLDLIDQGIADIDWIEILVLDEADRMLDMGFIHDIRKIIKMISDKCQVMMFSATMPPQILDLADKLLVDPKRISVDPPTSPVETIESSLFFVEKPDKFSLLLHLLKTEEVKKALVFMRTKFSANRIVKKLKREKINADAIHGNKTQNAREKALRDFKNGRIKVLVATDIAARGIDIDDITHVINFDMSNEAETYIHRIGRTARAGKSGIAFNFCMDGERPFLEDIERLIQQHLIRAEEYPFMSRFPAPSLTDLASTRKKLKSTYKKRKSKRTVKKKRRTSRK